MKIPKLSHHKATNRAYARVKGRCVYFGPWGTPQAEEGYRRLVAELVSAGGSARTPARPHVASVGEALAGYEAAMRDLWGDGLRGRQHAERLRYGLMVVRELYARLPLVKFGVPQLEACRADMVRRGWTRAYINRQVNIIRRAWRWLCARDIAEPSTVERMAALEHLHAGTSPAPEGKGTAPPPADHVERVIVRLQRTNPVLAAAVRVQAASGARTGELLSMTLAQIDRGGPVWVYRPARHKNAHRGKQRIIPLLPEAVAALQPLLEGLEPNAVIFDPRKAVAHARQCRTANPPGWRRRAPAGDPRPARDHYTAVSYAQCIARACRAEGLPVWRPYSLRHLAATRFEALVGPEAARRLLGHATLKMTAHYVHADVMRAAEELARKLAG